MSDQGYWWNPTVIAQREGIHELEVHIAELERQLESARSIAVDRDQRLAHVKEHVNALVDLWTDRSFNWTEAWGRVAQIKRVTVSEEEDE